MVRPPGADPGTFAMSARRSPAELRTRAPGTIRTCECRCVKPEAHQLSYAGMVLAARVRPTTSRFRSVCTAVVLRQQSSFRLAGNQRPCGLYRSRERLMQRGAQPENSLIHARDLTRAPLRARTVLTHAHPFGCERAQDRSEERRVGKGCRARLW